MRVLYCTTMRLCWLALLNSTRACFGRMKPVELSRTATMEGTRGWTFASIARRLVRPLHSVLPWSLALTARTARPIRAKRPYGDRRDGNICHDLVEQSVAGFVDAYLLPRPDRPRGPNSDDTVWRCRSHQPYSDHRRPLDVHFIHRPRILRQRRQNVRDDRHVPDVHNMSEWLAWCQLPDSHLHVELSTWHLRFPEYMQLRPRMGQGTMLCLHSKYGHVHRLRDQLLHVEQCLRSVPDLQSRLL